MHLAEVLLLVVVLLVASFAVHRVQLLRRGGTEVALRPVPNARGAGWRHGVLRYREDDAQVFRVVSVRAGADLTIARRTLEVLDRRAPERSEVDVLAAGSTVLHVRSGAAEVELALEGGALTAFLSWVESSPPNRARRRGPGARGA